MPTTAHSELTYVVFLFTYVRRTPTSKDDYADISAIRRQVALTQAFAKERGAASRQIPGWSMNRSKHFADTHFFREAVRLSRNHGWPLLVADIEGLLRQTPHMLVPQCLASLSTGNLTILDAATGQDWATMPQQEIAIRAMASRSRTSKAIKIGLKLGSAKRQSPPENRLRANSFRRRATEGRDELLRPVVSAWIAANASYGNVSPTALAKYLNAQGHLTARANAFSLNTTKDLLRRLDLPEPLDP